MKKFGLFIILIFLFSSLQFGNTQSLSDTLTAKAKLDIEFDEGSNFELKNVNQQQTVNSVKYGGS